MYLTGLVKSQPTGLQGEAAEEGVDLPNGYF